MPGRRVVLRCLMCGRGLIRGCMGAVEVQCVSAVIAHDVIESEFAENFQAMYEKVKHRALSELAAISDDEFSTGLKSMASDLKKESNQAPIIEPIDLFVYRMG